MGMQESELVKLLAWALVELDGPNPQKHLVDIRKAVAAALDHALILENKSEISKKSAVKLMNAWGDR